jgi:hypothetical protein
MNAHQLRALMSLAIRRTLLLPQTVPVPESPYLISHDVCVVAVELQSIFTACPE